MHIFYYCTTGVHTSLVAAAIHLGILPDKRVPKWDEIAGIPNYDGLAYENIGIPHRVGADCQGNEIYSVGVLAERDVVVRAIGSLLDLYQVPREQYLLVSTMEVIPYQTILGYFISVRLGLRSIGRTLAARGLTRVYPELTELVRRVKVDLGMETG